MRDIKYDFREIMKDAANGDYALAAFNVFGYEDAAAIIEAAEEMNAPILLATNKLAIDHGTIVYWGKMLRSLADNASVPVSVHLDHAKDYQTVAQAIKSGYTSVMYDGSHLPFEENVANTREIVKMAQAFGIVVEAEIGKLSYMDIEGHETEYTDPEEAKLFAEQTDTDWLAVSVGTVQRMQTQDAVIQFDRLKEIEERIDLPIVIHGSTGISDADMKKLVKTNVAKLNIGTAIRLAFGQALSEEVKNNPNEYDRLKLFAAPMEMVKQEAKQKLSLLGF
ncbi:class II fructose-bisphosphate aldolase [Sporosarcina sp. CAU 1771]